jgi:hypothetical protein
MVQFAFDCQGHDYANRQIYSVVYRLLLKISPVRLREPWGEQYICSEFNEACANILKLYIKHSEPNQIALPRDFTGPDFRFIGRLK